MTLYGYHPAISKLMNKANVYLTWMLSTRLGAGYAKLNKSRSLPSRHTQSWLGGEKHNTHGYTL